jgi:hypothetical protein
MFHVKHWLDNNIRRKFTFNKKYLFLNCNQTEQNINRV